MSRAYAIAASIFTALTLLLGYWCTRVQWAPRIDFDILGFLWLLQNLGPLLLVAITFCFGGAAMYLWGRSIIEGS